MAELAVAVLERWRAAEAIAPHAIELTLMIADCRIDGGDLDGAARELARAAEEGADPNEVLERIHRLEASVTDTGKVLSSDGMIALVEARAWTLTEVKNNASAAAAWRRCRQAIRRHDAVAATQRTSLHSMGARHGAAQCSA